MTSKKTLRDIAIRRRMIPIDSLFSKNRLEGESIDAYVTDLRYYAVRCGIADLQNIFDQDWDCSWFK